jgi:rod shape-determining protein MreC
MQPLAGLQFAGSYIQSLDTAQTDAKSAHLKLSVQTQKSTLVEQLQLENQRLRHLLELRTKPETTGVAAQVIYDAADPFTRKVVIDKGILHNLALGSPVLDESGVSGDAFASYDQ